MKIYADTSFLVSLYSRDANSLIAIRTLRTSAGERIVTSVGELEVVNAIESRVFREEISTAQAQSALADFEKHLRDGVFRLRGLSDMCFERANRLSRQTTARLGTRTADLLHVAAALELGVDYFYSFDKQQRKLAQSVRLKMN